MKDLTAITWALVRPSSAPAVVRSTGVHCLYTQDSRNCKYASFGEIFWCIEGRGWFLLDGNRRVIRPGEVWYYPPGSNQKFGPENENGFRCRWLTIEGAAAGGLFVAAGLVPGVNFGGSCPEELFIKLEMLIGRIARGHRIEALNCAFQILTRAASGVRKRGGTKIGDRSELVKRIIEENFSEPGFNVDRLAEIMDCGRVVISREFSRRFGVTLSGYIRSLRIRKALEMLEKYGTDIAEIAVECGYSSAGYFTKSLVAATGQTPSEFRALKRN